MLKFFKNKFLFYILLFIAIIILAIFIYLVVAEREAPEILQDGLIKKSEIISSLATKKRSEILYHHIPLNKRCQNEKDQNKKEQCFDKLELVNTIKGQNIKACLRFEKIDLRDDCLKELIPLTFNDNLCLAISDKWKRKTCKSRIIVNSRNDDLCEKYFTGEPFKIKECRDRVAAFRISDVQEKDDIYQCEGVDTLEYHNLCLMGVFTRQYNNDCGKAPLEYQDYCFAKKYLSEAKTKEDCYLIKLANYQKFCLLKIEAGNDLNEIAKIDSDNDGFPDVEELFYRLDPYNEDTDGDGLLDGDEIYKYGSNPADFDTDGDGLSDFEEIKMDTNFNNPDSDGDGLIDSKDDNPLDGLNDSDGDRLSDDEEKKWGTDPNNKDTDGDGTPDGAEIILYGTNPLGEGWQHDTDGDGLIDVDELFYGTDRLKIDTDGDGINDGDEVKNLTNPLGEGDMDFDEDGLSDKEELKYGTNPSKKDTNDDGVDDLEAIQKDIEAVSDDTDGDGLNNLYEKKLGLDLLNPDMDNDDLLDGEEINKYHTDPNNPDTDGDGYSDGEEVKAGYNPNGKGSL